MSRMPTILWQFFANGIPIITLPVEEILYSVISLTGTIAPWRHREFPYICSVRFPIQKSGLSPIYNKSCSGYNYFKKILRSQKNVPMVGVFVK
jgi:hypothetical protein